MKKVSTREKVKEYLVNFTSKNGYFPTFQEILEDLGFKSVSTVYYHLRALEEEGFLVRKEEKGKTYTIKNTGIFFRIPLKYKIIDSTLHPVNDEKKYFPASWENKDNIVAEVFDTSLSTYKIDKGILFLHKNEDKDGMRLYVDKGDNVIFSTEKLLLEDVRFIGCVTVNIKNCL